MQNIIALVAVAGALTTPQTGISMAAPVTVSTCAVTDLYDSAISPEFSTGTSIRMLQLTFRNTDDAVATEVTFDVLHDGAHTIVKDRGRFTKGVPIERLFDDLSGTDGSGPNVCTVAAVTFADGRRWIAPRAATTTAALR